MSEEKEKFRKLEGSFQYELLLAIRDARRLYLKSRIDPNLVPVYYDSVVSILDMIHPFLKKEDIEEVNQILGKKIDDIQARDHTSKRITYRRMLRKKIHELFRMTIYLCKKRKLIVTEITDEF